MKYSAVAWRRAETFTTRLFGLLGQPMLKPGEALWLAPCRAVHTCGMGYAIDVVFVSARGRILRIVPGLVPMRGALCLRAFGVAELRAGEAARLGWHVGMPLWN
jgi:hypothetical protein